MIRLADCRPADLPELASWFADPAEALLWGGPLVRWPLRIDALQAMLDEAGTQPPLRRCWSAFDGAAMVGHGQAVFDWAQGSARLARIAIAPDHRGRGLGKAMLSALIGALRANPAIRRISLNVYAHNEPAIALYRGLGFVMTGQKPDAVRLGDQTWHSMTMELPKFFSSDATSEIDGAMG